MIDNACGRVLTETLGQESKDVISVIATPMEDKAISKRLKYDTSRVRTILNELLAMNLVQVNRNRHDTGYCDYSWVRREDKIRQFVNN